MVYCEHAPQLHNKTALCFHTTVLCFHTLHEWQSKPWYHCQTWRNSTLLLYTSHPDLNPAKLDTAVHSWEWAQLRQKGASMMVASVSHAYLYATLGAAVLFWSHLIVILIVAWRLQTNAVIVEPIIAVVTRQHGAQLIVGLLAQAVDLGALLHTHALPVLSLMLEWRSDKCNIEYILCYICSNFAHHVISMTKV